MWWKEHIQNQCDPVIGLATAKTQADYKLGLALSKLSEEDPKLKTDEDSGQTIISEGGVALRFIIDRLKRNLKLCNQGTSSSIQRV